MCAVCSICTSLSIKTVGSVLIYYLGRITSLYLFTIIHNLVQKATPYNLSKLFFFLYGYIEWRWNKPFQRVRSWKVLIWIFSFLFLSLICYSYSNVMKYTMNWYFLIRDWDCEIGVFLEVSIHIRYAKKIKWKRGIVWQPTTFC